MRGKRAVRFGTISTFAAIVMATTTVAFAKQYSPWGVAVNAESTPGTSSELNTPFLDGCPIQSPDGLSLYMASNRTGSRGLDIWVAHRAGPDDPWGSPENLGAPINSEADDFCPTPVRGGGLFFVSSRAVAGSCGGPDMYFTRRSQTHGWAEPRNLGCHVNSAAAEASPSFFEVDGQAALYFSSNRPGGFAPEAPVDSDVYVAQLEAGDFGPAALAPGVNTATDDSRPNVRKDGLEIVFDSNRPGTLGGPGGPPDIYSASRATLTDIWSTPVNLGPSVNSASSESRASLSWDGMTLFFGSNRPGSELGPSGAPSNDIYFATRERIEGQG